MNPPNRTSILLLLLLSGLAIGWWLSKPQQIVTGQKSDKATEAPLINMQPIQPTTEPKVVQPYARTPYLGLSDPRWAVRRRLRKEDEIYEWKTPIEFFGKVIDEQGRPVEGASIEVAWSGTVKVNGGDGVGHRTLSSDPNGFFFISGVQGKGMTVRVSKDGYHVPSKSNMQWFEYAGFWEPTFVEPDRDKPVTFHLVKRPEAEPTYRIGQRIFLPPPGLEIDLDLLSPAVASTAPGDLHVRFTRSPGASYEKRFDWTVTIEGRNGAEIAETNEEFMLQAPADGYKPKVFREYKNAFGNARPSVRFYVRSKTRKLYAAVDFEMAAYRRMNGGEPASIVLAATVNPNNSPNLEYDPKKDIRDTAKR